MKKNKLEKIEQEIAKKLYHNINDLSYYLEEPLYIIRTWSKYFDILPHNSKNKTNKYWHTKSIKKFMLVKRLRRECLMTNAGVRLYLINKKRRYTVEWK